MSYILFIDDERFPPDDGQDWVIARNLDEVRATIARLGMPVFVSFDHDLGDDTPSGHEIARAMVFADLDAASGAEPSDDARGLVGALPADFSFTVHSQNPVGAKNIASILSSYLAHRASR